MAHPVHLGDLRRLSPIDPAFGGGRGKPIDRHYIEAFLARHAADVRGRVLEVAGDDYTRRFGGSASGRVVESAVLHVEPGHPRTTHVADLAGLASSLPSNHFDCFICTQTLQYVFDLRAAVATIERFLAPGGVLLLTVPGISQISPFDRDRWGEHWRFTPQSVQRLLREAFETPQVQGHGNVLAAIGFLHGLACEDLSAAELDHADERYPLLVAARAVKAGAAAAAALPPRRP